jgi:hypothetical protein
MCTRKCADLGQFFFMPAEKISVATGIQICPEWKLQIWVEHNGELHVANRGRKKISLYLATSTIHLLCPELKLQIWVHKEVANKGRDFI